MLKGKLSKYGVSSIGLFGSTVRNENGPDSDIDILVDFTDGKETFDNLMSVCDLLQSTFKSSKLDVVTKKGLSPYIESVILNETRYV
ncbi:MAG: nucleotidyltransferase family protein [Prevotella sp.]